MRRLGGEATLLARRDADVLASDGTSETQALAAEPCRPIGVERAGSRDGSRGRLSALGRLWERDGADGRLGGHATGADGLDERARAELEEVERGEPDLRRSASAGTSETHQIVHPDDGDPAPAARLDLRLRASADDREHRRRTKPQSA